MKQITLVIAENNEGTQLNESLHNLLEYNNPDTFDIIIVSDGSEIPIELGKYGDMVRHIKKPVREGVGAAFDTGAEYVTTPHMMIMGSDIRFRDHGVVDKMVSLLNRRRHQKSIICTTNLGINQSAGKTIHDEGLLKRYGARILFLMLAEDLPPKGRSMGQLKNDNAVSNYRNTLECKWLSKPAKPLANIPAVLGAFYGVRTSWYRYIDGFKGHRYWGTLEPFISLKSWFAGGDCRITTDIETGHLFKSRSSHVTRPWDLLYNKIAISRILFSRSLGDMFIDYLGTNPDMIAAKELVDFDSEKIEAAHEAFQKIKERDIHWFYDEFSYKYYDVIKNYTDEIAEKVRR